LGENEIPNRKESYMKYCIKEEIGKIPKIKESVSVVPLVDCLSRLSTINCSSLQSILLGKIKMFSIRVKDI